MAGGLFALLDDVAALARMAAASIDDVGAAAGRATTKAAGVVVDDTAVTPQYVHGVTADRELPMIKRITVGSLRNKLLIILPLALLLSQFVPWLLTPILMLGGSYLCYEGAEKVWHRLRGQDHHDTPVAESGPEAEKTMVAGAIRTDLILSTEIMLISLASLDKGLDVWSTLAILAVIALLMTVAVYGVVALLVKIDDIGLKMAKNPVQRVRHTGTRIVRSMPAVFRFISVLGTVAMLWVGGHLVLINLGEVGLHAPADLLHAVEHALEPLGGVVVWIVDTLISAIAGLVWGLVIVGIVLGIARLFGKKPSFHEGETSPADVHA